VEYCDPAYTYHGSGEDEHSTQIHVHNTLTFGLEWKMEYELKYCLCSLQLQDQILNKEVAKKSVPTAIYLCNSHTSVAMIYP